MIRRIVSFSLQQPLFVLLGIVLFVVGGIIAFDALPVEAFPDVSDIQVTVITLYPGRAAEEVEKQVTIPLEIALSRLPHAVRMFSHTQFGLSFIMLTFDDKATDYFARQQVLERLRDVDLPPGVQPQLAPLSTPIGEIYRYPPARRRAHAAPSCARSQDWVVETQLRARAGRRRHRHHRRPRSSSTRSTPISRKHARLQGHAAAAVHGAGARQRQRRRQLRRAGAPAVPHARHRAASARAADIGHVVVAEHNGTPILVKDIADVDVGAVPRQGMCGQDDDDDIVTGIVLMRKGENPSRVLAALKETHRPPERDRPAEGRADRAVLRPHVADRHDAAHGVHQPAEGAMLVTLVLFSSSATCAPR